MRERERERNAACTVTKICHCEMILGVRVTKRGCVRAFNGIGFGELCAVFNQRRGECIPCLIRGEAEVHMRAGEIVGVELDVTMVFDQVSPFRFLFCTEKPNFDVYHVENEEKNWNGKGLRERERE